MTNLISLFKRRNLRHGFVTHSAKGFSLVEMMVAVGMLSIVSLGIATIASSTSKQITQSSDKADRNSLQNSISSVLQRPESCARNLNGIRLGTVPNVNFTTIRDYDESGTVIATLVPGLNTPIFVGSNLRVSEMRVTGPGGSGSPVLISSAGSVRTYLADVQVKFVTRTDTGSLKPIIVPSLLLNTNPGGNLQSCQSGPAASPSTTCTSLGLVWDSARGVCVPRPERTCEQLGGTFDAGTGKCSMTPELTMTCPAGEAVNRFVDGVPVCEPIVSGIWSPWSPAICPTSCGTAPITRTCLVGTCSGSTTSTCSNFEEPVRFCNYRLIQSGAPYLPGSCGGGGGSDIFCSGAICPAPGSRQTYWFNPACTKEYF